MRQYVQCTNMCQRTSCFNCAEVTYCFLLWSLLVFFFPNRSLLLRVLIGVKERVPERHTKREAASAVSRPGIARAPPPNVQENKCKYENVREIKCNGKMLPKPNFPLVNDTSAAPNVRETNCKYEHVREINCNGKMLPKPNFP